MTALHRKIAQIRRRVLGVGAAAAAFWVILAIIGLLLLAAWLDLLWEMPPDLRTAAVWIAGAIGLLLLGLLMVRLFRSSQPADVARRLDAAGESEGRIFTGWELAERGFGRHNSASLSLSAGLAHIAVERASSEAVQVPLDRAAPLRPALRSAATLIGVLALVGVLWLGLPNLARTQWNRFWHPTADVPPFSLTEFTVTPGNASVIYGNDLEIRAAVRGTPVEQLELVLETPSGQQSLPMFQESGGGWRAVLSKITESSHYFVRAYHARSVKYGIDVITVPLLENARVRITPPAYAARAAYDGPVPKDGISGLKDTNVQFILRSNRPLKSGTVRIASGTKEQTISLAPIEAGSQEVAGAFALDKDGKFECRVIDEAGQVSQQSCAGNLRLLPDERPFVRIVQPDPVSLATPSAVLPVAMMAEDDCGVTRLQLFRSLNESRPLPADLLMPAKLVRRADGQMMLPLDQYGLTPGDVIKLFARVEDNDPAGHKGSESSITTVRIISEADFARMLRRRQGLEELVTKYYAARRQMETMSNQLEAVRKKVASLPPGDEMSQQTREEIERLEKQIRKQAEEIRRSIKQLTDFDLDKNLLPELEKTLEMSEKTAKALEQLAKERELINSKLGDRLDEILKKLAEQRKHFEQQAVKPLEYLEAVLPLKIDENRFVQIVLWQEDLAERMATLKGHDGEDNPSLKSRMRDLEQEQWQIRAALAKLLDDIQEHSQQLPDLPELQKLRETAQAFSSKVRASGATVAMAAAEAALAEFAGTPAHEKAKEAAEILRKFLKDCNSLKSCSNKALAFQPSLSKNLGDTINQMLGDGSGSGSGMNGNDFGSVGMYGPMPAELAQQGLRGGNQRSRGRQFSKNLEKRNPDEDQPGDVGQPGEAAGASQGAVPAQYRRQVGQYFERVSEETGEKGR